nr:hypothetical protein [Cohnella fermenti]
MRREPGLEQPAVQLPVEAGRQTLRAEQPHDASVEPSPLQRIQAMAMGDPVKPGREVLGSPVLMQGLVSLDQHLLNRVLRILPVRQQAVAVTEDRLLNGFDDPRVNLLIALLNCSDPPLQLICILILLPRCRHPLGCIYLYNNREEENVPRSKEGPPLQGNVVRLSNEPIYR